jgi:DNA-binding beta-propeller fold protein YncE
MDQIADTNDTPIGVPASRRSIGRFLAGGALAGILAPFELAGIDAKRNNKKKRRKKKRPNGGAGCGQGETRVANVCVQVFGRDGAAAGEFSLPSGAAFDGAGRILVADTNNDRVQVFDRRGESLDVIGSTGTADGQFSRPQGIAVAEGNVFVADSGNARIQKFDGDGNHLATFGNAQLRFPSAIGCSAGGTVFATDVQTSTVSVFNENGFFLRSFAGPGSGDGKLNGPNGVAINGALEVFVADTQNHRIQVFDDNGRFLRGFGAQGSGNGQFEAPRGIAVDIDGSVWVSDRDNHRVQQFLADGTFRRAFGREGDGPGEFDTPFGLAVRNGDLVVVDGFNERVQVLAFVPVGAKSAG